MLKAMAMPIMVMGELQIAFASIHSMFQVVDNLIKVTMNGAFDTFRNTTSTNVSQENGLNLNLWAKRNIISQVTFAAQVACTVHNLTELYTKMYNASIHIGLNKVLEMQKLMGKSADTDKAEIEKAKKELIEWAQASLDIIDTIVQEERDQLMQSMDERVKQIASHTLAEMTFPGLSALDDAKKQAQAADMKVADKATERKKSVMTLNY